MYDKHGYWKERQENAEIANLLTQRREVNDIDEINWCVQNTTRYPFYGYKEVFAYNDGYIPKITLYPLTTTDAILTLGGYNSGRKTCVLNFASFKHPGGMFLKGSMAQEESLCRKSILYNVLSRFEESYYKENRKDVNRSLYYNKALYTPGIKFTFRLSNNEQVIIHSDILTCAAPNYRSARRYHFVDINENLECLKSRIRFVLNILSMNSNQFDILILGAFGCGVFGQPPSHVSKLFNECIKEFKWDLRLKEIAFAVPDSNNPIAHANFVEFYNNITCANL